MANDHPPNEIDWKGGSVARSGAEAVLGENDFQNPWFLLRGWKASQPVCMLRQSGTAFLIAESTVMTNWHVLRTADYAKNLSAFFNYEEGPGGIAMTPDEFVLDPSTLFYSNEELDYAVCFVNGKPGQKFGYIDITKSGHLALDGRVNIVQHPDAGLKKIAIRANGIKYFDEKIIQYWADTDHGSSGSPVFDDNWIIVGLHYQSASAKSESGEVYYNEAHRIDAIARDLATRNLELMGRFSQQNLERPSA